MIVKNSGEVLRHTLRSFLPHVDYFCICDTGSTDGITEKILLEETEDCSGFLFKEEFVDFSHNRNRVLEEAEKMYPDCYYVTIDDSYTLENPEGFDSFFETATGKSYLVFVKNEETQYLSVKISTKGMRYRYRIHEIMDPPERPEVVRDFIFLEARPEDHRQRTADRAEFDLKCLRKDLEERPKDPRLMFYIGRTLYNQNKLLEAAEWFKERILLEGCRYEKYQSMIYIAIIAERTHHSSKEVMDLYLGIHQMFPEYKEPLYYAAVAAAEMGNHKKTIELLEKFYYSEIRPEFCDKHILTTKEVPKMLCSYYFKTDLEKCVPFLYRHYVSKDLPFDYTYESYLRYIYRIDPRASNTAKWIVYSDNLSPENFRNALPLADSVVFDESQERLYQMMVTSYAIENVLVSNRVDRIPFFPNVKNVYLLLTKDTPSGGALECFPALRAIIAKTPEHANKIRDTYLSESAKRLLITLEQFLSVVM
jgi:hypothetical protein